MRPLPAVLAVASLLLAGCSSDPPGPAAPAAASGDAVAPYAAAPAPLRFASGNVTASLEGTSTFSITAQCAFTCTDGQDIVDLTPLVPADAPVELLVTVTGARSMITYTDTYALGVGNGAEGDWDGQATSFAGIFIRGASGAIQLHVFNPGGFGFPPEPAPTADYAAQSLVRADRLAPGVPAGLQLKPGDRLELTSEGVKEAVLLAPDGSATRDVEAPYELVANGTAGLYTLLMLGQDATPVLGPNGTTMAARRILLTEGTPQSVASGTPTTWSFDAATAPLLVGVGLRFAKTAGDFTAAPTMTQWELTLSSPGNAEVARDGDMCTPFCDFVPLSAGTGFQVVATSDFLATGLDPGSYAATASYTGTAMEGVAFAVVLA